MLDDENVVRVMQYQKPPAWMEWLAYSVMVGLFAGAYLGNVWALAVLTGGALYWNYRLFDTIRAYVKYVNAMEFSKLLAVLAENELNKQKDGTIPERDGLTKEHDSEGTEGD